MALQAATPEVLVKLQEQQAAKRKVNFANTVKDIKSAKFFQENWNDLLIAAPNCLQLLATCGAVAASDAAGGIRISKPAYGSFKYLKHETLKGNLADTFNQGQNSFTVAADGMMEIEGECRNVRAFVERINASLVSMDTPVESLVGHMEDLKDSAGRCRKRAEEIHASFSLWQEFAMELYGACNNESALVEKKQQEMKAKLEFADEYSKGQKAITEKYEKAVDEMNQNVKDCKEEYKQQLEDFPGAWTLLGQQLAVGLVESVGTAATVATSIATQSAMAAANPVGTAAQLAGAASRFQGQGQPIVVVAGAPPPPVKDASKAEEAAQNKEKGASKLRNLFKSRSVVKQMTPAKKEGDPKEETKTGDSVVVPADAPAPTPSASSAQPATNGAPAAPTWPPCDGKLFATDPAMAAIDPVAALVDGLKALIIDAEGTRNVKWDEIMSKPATEGQPVKNSTAFTVKCGLERRLNAFKPDPKGLASQLMTRILTESLAIANELLEEARKSKDLGGTSWKAPEADSAQVKSWDDRISMCSEAATIIKQSANSTPGNLPGGVGSLFPKKTDAEVQASTTLKTNLAAETIKAATTKLTSAQEVYKNTLETYKDMRAKSAELQKDLITAQAEVEQLKLQKVTEANVREILIKCIGFLAELKVKIGKLAQFFKNVTIFVNAICDSQVKPFERELTLMIKNNPGDELKAFRYNAYYRDIIFQLTLQIYAQFSLFRDVTGMYLDVHNKTILEGLDLVAKCAIPSVKAFSDMSSEEKAAYNKLQEDRRQEMTKYGERATGTISDIVGKKQDEIIKGIQQRVFEIEQQIEVYPVELRPSKEKQEQIQAGRQIAESSNREAMHSQPSGMALLTGGEGELDGGGDD